MRVTSVSLNFGPTTGNTPVFIYGENFAYAPHPCCRFGRNRVSMCKMMNDSTIETRSPRHWKDNVAVEVSRDCEIYTKNMIAFHYYNVPQISMIYPSKGLQGTTITLFGSQFTRFPGIQCAFG